MAVNLSSGGFEGEAYVKSFGGAEKYRVISPSGKISESGPDGKIKMEEFGFHTVIPVTGLGFRSVERGKFDPSVG